jgi:3D (Asp-Asp-Asp) domain-containing protein
MPTRGRRSDGRDAPRARWVAHAAILLLLLCATRPLAWAGDPFAGTSGDGNLNGRLLGQFKLTYYRLAEANAARADAAPGFLPIQGRDCARVLAWVPSNFYDDLGIQGSGVLPDGRLLNFEQRCSCAAPTTHGERICYAQLKRTDFPFGRGAQWKRQHFWLQPLRSAAVDPAVVPIGSVLYVPALEGRTLEHGMAHNGCIRAEDTGRGVQGLHVDLFAGSTRTAPELPKKLPLGTVSIYIDAKRCRGAFP